MAKKRATPADPLWKRPWPRSADVRAWMHALLTLADHIESPRERTDTTVSCAIGQLTDLGHLGDALDHVERIFDSLPPESLYERRRMLIMGAEQAIKANDPDRMEDYLGRIATLGAAAEKKKDRASAEQAIRWFRSHHGLLAPLEVTDPKERTDAAFRSLLRDASVATKRRDAKTAAAKLAEAEATLPSMEGWRRKTSKRILIHAYHDAGDNKNLERLLKEDDQAGPGDRMYPSSLAAMGQRDRAARRYEQDAAEALDQLRNPRGPLDVLNSHGPASTASRAIIGLADLGETDRARHLLTRMLDEGQSWQIIAPGAFSADVMKSVAEAVARLQGNDAALGVLKLGMERALGDKRSDWRTEAIRSNVELLIELSPPGEAVTLAKTVKSPAARRTLLAKVFAARGAWDDLHATINGCKKPMEAAELIWSIKFVWLPAN